MAKLAVLLQYSTYRNEKNITKPKGETKAGKCYCYQFVAFSSTGTLYVWDYSGIYIPLVPVFLCVLQYYWQHCVCYCALDKLRSGKGFTLVIIFQLRAYAASILR